MNQNFADQIKKEMGEKITNINGLRDILDVIADLSPVSVFSPVISRKNFAGPNYSLNTRKTPLYNQTIVENENGKSLLLDFAMPGFTKEEIKISFDERDRILKISASKEEKLNINNLLVNKNIPEKLFVEVSVEKHYLFKNARMQDGILYLTFEKNEKKEEINIEIT